MTCNPIDPIVAANHQPPMPPWNSAVCIEKSLAANVKGTLHCTVRVLYLIRFTLEWCTDARSLWNDRQMSSFNRNPWPGDLCFLASKMELPLFQVLGRWFWSICLNFSNCLGVNVKHFQPHVPANCSDSHEDVLPLWHPFEMSLPHVSPGFISVSFLATHLQPGSCPPPPLDIFVYFIKDKGGFPPHTHVLFLIYL